MKLLLVSLAAAALAAPALAAGPPAKPAASAQMFPAAAPAKPTLVELGEFAASSTIVDKGYCPQGEAGHRRQTRPITFAPAFAAPPRVALTVNSLDAPGTSSDARNVRYSVYAQNVTQNGATVVIETWCDTDIWQLSGSIIAVGTR